MGLRIDCFSNLFELMYFLQKRDKQHFEEAVIILSLIWILKNDCVHKNITINHVNFLSRVKCKIMQHRRKRVDGDSGDRSQQSPKPGGVTTYSVDAACTNFACSYAVTRQPYPLIDLTFKVGTFNSTRPDLAEANAILEALYWALSLKEKEIHIQSDCLSIVLFLQGRQEAGPWWLQTTLYKCKEAVSKFQSATISHISRRHNILPHHLAQWTLQNMHNGFLSCLPDQVRQKCLLRDDHID